MLVGPNGALIDALYSASMAGSTEDRRYVWGGATTFPHLTAVDDSAWANASSDPYAGMGPDVLEAVRGRPVRVRPA
ncbi:MAG: hypothetical protein WKF58_05435 [Ilumatobacteraceae bacterium]